MFMSHATSADVTTGYDVDNHEGHLHGHNSFACELSENQWESFGIRPEPGSAVHQFVFAGILAKTLHRKLICPSSQSCPAVKSTTSQAVGKVGLL